jgi:DNA-binding SARP family transcriptional activator
MEFGILGPLLVRDETGVHHVNAPKQRILLAALLLRPGCAVPMDTLVQTLWDGQPPRSATASVRNYVMRLRNGLGSAGRRISSRSCGYLAEIEEGELDLLRFERLREQGTAAVRDGALERGAAKLGEAVGLWRGPALADVPSDTLHRDECPRLAESRLSTLELKLEAESRLGRHGPVIAELQGLTAAHPERERLWVQLMTALYRTGRQSEALAAYQRIRWILVEEIGVEPGAELRAVHQQILTADPILDHRPVGPDSIRRAVVEVRDAVDLRAAAVVTPFQIPADLSDFTGRAEESDELIARLGEAGQATSQTSAITGPAGIGKSALAIRAAHAVRPAFPDGTLFANLHDADNTPARPGDILASFLRALGLAAHVIPPGLDDRSALFRSMIADRRLLVVLDNARDTAQISPLLPGTAAGATLITSRNRLADLPGAHRITLGAMSPHEATTLLGRIAGPARIEAEPLAVAEMVAACGRLPLALRIAASRLATRPSWTVRHLADRLADDDRRLDELKVGALDIRAGLALSYDTLDPAAARAFCLLALLNVPTISTEVAAAVLGEPFAHVERLMEDLVDVHLLTSDHPTQTHPTHSGCYTYPTLVRVFARELALACRPPVLPAAYAGAVLLRFAPVRTSAAVSVASSLPTATATASSPGRMLPTGS